MFWKTVFVLFCLSPICLLPVDIAITLDDFPMGDGPLFSAQEKTKAFLKACDNHHCAAAFFCIGQHCSVQGADLLLSQVNDSGHFLANHSMTHSHLSAQSLTEFEEEIRQTEAILIPYQNMRKWFRYPFLDYGNRVILGGSPEKTLQSIKILKKLGYVEGFVTINAFDWHINARLTLALKQGKSIDCHALKRLYLDLLKDWCTYYCTLYQTEFSERIPHTLLLHANDLNALFLEDILQMIETCGWNIVSPEAAFADVRWRKKIRHLGFVVPTPESLNCQEIDRLLEEKECFLP